MMTVLLFAGCTAKSSTAKPNSHLAVRTSSTLPSVAAPLSTTSTTDPPEVATITGDPATFPPTGRGPLNSKVVAIDPGHNGGNAADAAVINQMIFNGRASETCDTTGTETDAGYTEARFNWNVAQDVAADVRAEGATVVLTRTSNAGVGPCVTERAVIGNQAKADAAVSIHADGGPAAGRGFAILLPVADGPNEAIITASHELGVDLRDQFSAVTGEPISTYDGVQGLQPRDDLGGTNLSTVPKVFIECANMRNAVDAALVTSSAWQTKAALGIADGIEAFLAPD